MTSVKGRKMELVGHAVWNFLIDADNVTAISALCDKDSLLAVYSCGYEEVDRMVKLFVPLPGLLHSDLKGKRRACSGNGCRPLLGGQRWPWINANCGTLVLLLLE